MRVTEWMNENGVQVGVSAENAEEVRNLLLELQGKQIKQKTDPIAAVGAGVAFCRSYSRQVRQPMITAVNLSEGVDLQAPDGEPSKLIFMVLLPENAAEDPASRLTVMLMNEDLREQLMVAANESSFLHLLRSAEAGIPPDAPEQQRQLHFPLPSLLLLIGSLFLLGGRFFGLWSDSAAAILRKVGEAMLFFVPPLALGAAAYRVAHWKGLVLGCAGGILGSVLCGPAVGCLFLLWFCAFCSHEVK